MPRFTNANGNSTDAPVEIEYSTSNSNSNSNSNHNNTTINRDNGKDKDVYDGPVDLDELFMPSNLEQIASDDGSLFSDDDFDGQETLPLAGQTQYFSNPNKRVSVYMLCVYVCLYICVYIYIYVVRFYVYMLCSLNTCYPLLNGSSSTTTPLSSRDHRSVNLPIDARMIRPSEPLSIAKYASTCAFLSTVRWVETLLMVPFWFYDSFGRIVVEMI